MLNFFFIISLSLLIAYIVFKYLVSLGQKDEVEKEETNFDRLKYITQLSVGSKVIVRSNEKEPAVSGEIVGWEEFHGKFFPLVKYDKDDKEYICFGIVIPYYWNFFEYLNYLGPKKSWELLRNISIAIQERTSVSK